MIDPVFSEYASPFWGIGPRRFHTPPIALVDLPNIDAVMISHDHYDHLDIRTIQHLSAKGSHFFVPLGVGAHLEEWGVPESRIVELDWWASAEIGDLTMTCTPAQHYSSRGIFDYKATFWSSWSIAGPKHRVFYSGDTGFSDHFQLIGNQLGPFDLSIMRIGQYGPGASWIYSNMSPEDAVQAHLDIRANRMLPVHWGTFNIAFHDWDEPIRRAVEAAKENGVDLATPRAGEIVVADQPFISHDWWEDVR
jgi:L-ascorbate metabolism protein UlaG (beta-lactamase superfamily)